MARPSTAAVRLTTGEREPCRLATTANITLSGLQTIDGVLTEVGDRVLVKDQTDQTENGIYTASAGEWYRAADARTARNMQKGTTVHIQQGSTNESNVYSFQTYEPNIGEDAIVLAFYTSDDTLGDVNDAVAAGLVSIGNAGDAELADISDAGAAQLDAIAEAGADVTAIRAGDTDASGFGFVIDEDDMASDSDTKVPTQQSVNQGKLQKVATRTAMKALSGTAHTAVYLCEAGREGSFKWNGSDISASVIGADITSTSVASSTITSADHGLDTGMAVLVDTAVNGLSVGTFYYVIRVDVDNFKLASSYANAVAGTSVTFTGTSATTVNQHFDPLEGIYVTPTSDKTGASGAWARVRDTEIVPVKWFGALADNSTNDSPAIQAAWNYVVSIGGVLLFSRGRHVLTQALNFYTNIQSGSDMRRAAIRGHGAGATALVFQGANATSHVIKWGCQEDAITAQNNLHGYVTHGGFSIECADLANNGFHAFRQAWFRVEDIRVGSPKLSGFNFESCVSFSVLRLKPTGGTGGILMQKGTNPLAFSSPNAISVIDCTCGASTLGGLRLFDPGPVTVIGGSVESCGTHGDATTGGITVSVTATSTNISATALNVVGTYFEGNGGGADILVQNNDDRPTAVTVVGANFNRTLDTKYVTNNICLNHTGTGLMSLGVRGCGFASVSPYVPDAARKAIGLIGTAATYKNIEISSDNAFQNSVERPDNLNGPWGLPNLAAEAYVRAGTDGTVVSAMSHNIASVVHNSTGDYTITYNYAMREATNCYSGMIVGGAGYVSVYGETTSSVSIRTRTDAGTLTDMAFTLHVKGRHP